jgi:ribosomal subunit interface protein
MRQPTRQTGTTMKIKFRELNVDVGGALRAHAQTRIALVLARFADRIAEVVVRFSEESDKRPGQGGRCEIEVGLSPRRVRAADDDTDLFAAVERAAARVARSVARALEQERELADLAANGGLSPRGRGAP